MCSTTCTTTPLRANQATATILLQKISRIILVRFFHPQPDGLFRMLTYVVIIHIGVGPNVVCSTIPGNAKSSVRGTDSKEISTFEPENPSLNHLYISFVYNREAILVLYVSYRLSRSSFPS